jgi:2-oxoisovalerate dehydrogenase E1 component
MRGAELTAARAYWRMAFIRRFEEEVLALSLEGGIAGSVHPCIGQEAIPVGAVAAIEDRDRIVATYRGHGWALASGSEPVAVFAEIAQKAGGLNGGRAGSAMLSNPSTGFLCETSIVGAGSPIGAGVALAAKTQGTGRVVLVSVGDGAMNQGATAEGMIFAATRDLPVIFLCENNGWSEMTPTALTTRGLDLVKRGEALGIDSHIVDGNDPFAVQQAVAAAAERCRTGNGPVFLECKTVRLKGHYNKDIEHYRPKADQESAKRRDPLARLLNASLSAGLLAQEEIDEIDVEISQQIADMVAQVKTMPAPSPNGAQEHLYAPRMDPAAAAFSGPPRALTYQRAVNQALADELRARPDLLIYGEDVGFAGGIFGVSRGLQKQFGDERVFDTPISEAAILGSAVGAGLEGVRAVVEIMWADFVFVALDQIVNQASNVRYINRGTLHAPLTVRMQQGVTPGSCAQHSQSIEAVLAHVPGIKVGLPSTPQDAYDMTRAAIADPDPTVLIENRNLYQETGPVSTGAVTQRAEGARLHRTGPDLAIITWGGILGHVLAAADELAGSGIGATVLDLRWLSPVDDRAIAEAVAAGNGRVLIVHEATVNGGFGAEIAARIAAAHFGQLAAPPMRLGTPPVRMPAAPALQESLLPGTDRIMAAARALRSQVTQRLPVSAG